MKIKKIHIKNYRSIKKLDLDFPDKGVFILVGPNNAGKSNILSSINNLIGETWWGGDKAELNDFYQKKKENKINIQIEFDNSFTVELDSDNKWPKYKDAVGDKIGPWNAPEGSSGSVKDDFPCTYLEANRTVEDSMQFRSWKLMGKIAKSFNEKAQPKKQEIEDKFNEVMDIFDSIHEFKNFKEDFVKFFDELQADSPYKLKVDFKAFSPLNYFKSICILANDKSINNEYDTDLLELGDGNKNLVLFALVRSYAKNFKQAAQGILAIEEPEIYLHPQAQKHLYSVLKEIVKGSNIQIIFTTHSPCFVNTDEFFQIGIVSKSKEEGTQVKRITKKELVNFCIQTGVPEEKTNIDNIGEFYATTSNYRLNEAFFSKFTVLVEGETEELALPIYLKKEGLNCDTSGISIVGVNGKNQIPKYWRLFYSFKIPILIVFDNDNSANKVKSNENISKCFNCNISDITSEIDVCKELNATKQMEGKDIFSQKILVLENDFETAIKKDFESYCQKRGVVSKYSEYESEAKGIIKPLFNTQKGQIARYIAKKITNEFPDFKPKMVNKILNLISQNAINYNPTCKI